MFLTIIDLSFVVLIVLVANKSDKLKIRLYGWFWADTKISVSYNNCNITYISIHIKCF